MDLKKELGNKIKRLRQQKGLTQEQLAEKANISLRTLGGIELGKNFMTAQTMETIIQCLDVSIEEFFNAQHLKPTKELVLEIHRMVDNVSSDSDKIEEIYKILRAICTI